MHYAIGCLGVDVCHHVSHNLHHSVKVFKRNNEVHHPSAFLPHRLVVYVIVICDVGSGVIMKYVVVIGSIMSGLGKGVLTASIAKMLWVRGIRAFPLKFDGYLNVDCGTMNPFRHGEVFVLDDGAEVDMDFGTYERFLNKRLNSQASITGGKIFKHVIEKERRGEFLGEDVQIIPHLTNEIKQWIRDYGRRMGADVVLIEVGGTVGDIENSYFIEAVRQLLREEDGVVVQLTWVPELAEGEQKTKPTQHANKLIRTYGLIPELIVARCNHALKQEVREKLALFCDVEERAIFYDPPLPFIYSLPLELEKQGFADVLLDKLNIKGRKEADWSQWRSLLDNVKKGEVVRVGIVGKYVKVRDAYVSILEALTHAAAHTPFNVESVLLDAENFDVSALSSLHAIIVPGGFGSRGVEGKIEAIKYAREHNVPFLGICLGMQLMVVEYARNVLGWKDANSTEFDANTEHNVIDLLPEQRAVKMLGGSMRLGLYEAEVKTGTQLFSVYGHSLIKERHRHRYEVNTQFLDALQSAGLRVSAVNPQTGLVEAVEWSNGFGIGVQFHPELTSTFEQPNPLFISLVKRGGERAIRH